jgi:hypothetical protein
VRHGFPYIALQQNNRRGHVSVFMCVYVCARVKSVNVRTQADANDLVYNIPSQDLPRLMLISPDIFLRLCANRGVDTQPFFFQCRGPAFFSRRTPLITMLSHAGEYLLFVQSAYYYPTPHRRLRQTHVWAWLINL